MSGDIDKINEIFRIHDQQAQKEEPAPAQPEKQKRKGRTSPVKAVDELFTDKTGQETHNYTGDEESERDYHPVRQSREYHSGCMGGIM